MDIAIVSLAWIAIWAFGTAVVGALRTPGDWAAPGEAAWTKGCGFLAGAFLVTVWMRVLSAIGIPFGVASILLPLALATAAAIYVVRRRMGPRFAPELCNAARSLLGFTWIGGWRRTLFLAILAWLALRYALLFVQVVLQPLYPWDAWIQWATKAHVWFELRRIVPFVDLQHWQAAGGAFYTDASPNYPATVPLWQVFSSVVLGRFDDALMNVPWWMLAVAFGVAIYGALRRMAFDALAALVGAALVLTLPIVDAHVALAGYADLPMAAYFTVAALATLFALESRKPPDIALAAVFVIALPTIKNPGLVWLATLAAPLCVALMPRIGRKVVLGGFALTLVALLVLAQTSATILNYHLHLDFAPPWNGLFESLFMLGTWNLMWYGVVAAAVLGARDALAPRIAPLTALVGAGVLFLFFVFAFTNARAWVESQTTVNRALLHLAPLLVVWAMLLLRAFAARHPAPDAPAPATA
jgi:hypothetical protein